MLHATAPLFAAPIDRGPVEFALTCLAKVRFLSEDSLAALAGPRGFRRELTDDWVKSGIVHRGVVKTDVITGREVSYLALTTRGARALEAATGRHAEGVSAPALRRESQKRLHDLCAGEAMAAFMALQEQGAVDLLGVEVDCRKIGTSVVLSEPGRAPERVPLEPDGLVVVNTNGPSALLMEMDLGSVSVDRMARKYAGFLEWMRQHGPERDFAIRALRVLTLAPTEKRLARLHDAALRMNHGQRSGFLVFGLIENVNVAYASRIFDPVVRQLGAKPNERVPLLSQPSPSVGVAA